MLDTKQRFTLLEAAQITEFSVMDLRNHIKRGLLKYIGTATAGKEREFGLLGMYEIGLIDELRRSGLTLIDAAGVVHTSLEACECAKCLAMVMESRPPTAEQVGFEESYRETSRRFDEAQTLIGREPECLLRGEWTYRDLIKPALWVFILDNHGHLELANGWGDVERAAKEAVRTSYPRLIRSVSQGSKPEHLGEVPEDYVLTAHPHIHVFNLTAALTTIDRAISERVTKAQA